MPKSFFSAVSSRHMVRFSSSIDKNVRIPGLLWLRSLHIVLFVLQRLIVVLGFSRSATLERDLAIGGTVCPFVSTSVCPVTSRYYLEANNDRTTQFPHFHHRVVQRRWRQLSYPRSQGNTLVTASSETAECNEKLSCRRETVRRFVSLNISLSHSRSLKVIWNDTVE